jgi:hypothetical protein
MRSMGPVAVLALAAAAGVLIVAACGTGAVDTQACKAIETARCQVAPSCPADFDLQSPDPSGDPVAACIRFYNDQCLHGLATSVTPSSTAVNGCVTTILAAGKVAAASHSEGDDAAVPCATIVAPQNTAACAFLNPVDAGEDAGPCSGSAQCVGAVGGGVDCCATIVLEASPDGGAYPNCGVASLTSYCGICSNDVIGATCLSTENVHLCSLESDCSNEAVNTQCCQLSGYQACVSPAFVSTAGGITCL